MNVRLISIGKNTYICDCAAAVARSYGLDWQSINAAEIGHGELGQIQDDSYCIFVSKSGRTQEVANAYYLIRIKLGNVNGMLLTGTPNVRLGNLETNFIAVGEEGSLFGHAPHMSLVVFLDYLLELVGEYADMSGITVEQYAANHPSGQIGDDTKTLRG